MKIRFDEDSHRYYVSNAGGEVEVPSVSFLLSVMNLEFDSWRIPEANFKKGSAFHALTETYDLGIMDESIFDTQTGCDWWNLYSDFKSKWGKSLKEEIEVQLYHPDGFCGRIDRVFNSNLVVDYKTGTESVDNFKPTLRHRQQLALYRALYHKNTDIDPWVGIIYFDLKDLKWKYFEITLSNSEYHRTIASASIICSWWRQKKGGIACG